MNGNGKNVGWIVAVVLLIAGFLGVVIWRMADKKANQVDYSKYDVNSIIAGNEDNGGIGDHVKGSADAPVVIYEYADYQCSGCASANPRVNKLLTEYDGKLAVVYRNFLLSYHQNGTAAASAAEAAGLQGYYKEYADKLFANQSVWASATGNSRTDMFLDLFRNVTGGKGDEEKFIADMGSAEVKAKIDFDTGLSENLDIPGTPSFFLNGERIDLTDISTEDAFLKLMREKIDAALKAVK